MMQLVQGLLGVLALGVGYLLFFQSQPHPKDTKAAANPPAAAVATAKSQPRAASPNDPYKASLDRAQVVVGQMNAAHKEADSF